MPKHKKIMSAGALAGDPAPGVRGQEAFRSLENSHFNAYYQSQLGLPAGGDAWASFEAALRTALRRQREECVAALSRRLRRRLLGGSGLAALVDMWRRYACGDGDGSRNATE